VVGKTISHYHLLEKLGGGAMGEVHLAPGLRIDENYRRRFIEEAECASGLNDHRIAGIYDVFEEHDEFISRKTHISTGPVFGGPRQGSPRFGVRRALLFLLKGYPGRGKGEIRCEQKQFWLMQASS
jgi:serine/threonine protein kinase